MPRSNGNMPIAGISKLRLDTSLVRGGERFDFYREVLGQQVLRVTPERPPGGAISASIDAVMLDNNVTISRIKMSSNIVRRTEEDLSRSSNDLYHLGVNCSGRFYKSVNGQYRQRKQDTVYFADSSVKSDYMIGDGSDVTLICVVFPKTLIRGYLDKRMVNRGDVGDINSIALLNSMKLLDRRLEGASVEEIGAISSAIISLLTADLLEKGDRAGFLASQSSTKAGLLIIAKKIINHSLASDKLSPSTVADQLGISVRYLQKIFENDGLTFHGFYINQKYFQIRKSLLEDRNQDLSIAEIAAKWGISDITSFYRNYKAQFDETPKQTRLLLKDRLR